MADSLRDPKVGAHMLAFLALTDDEPKELALEYLKTAHQRLGFALNHCRGPRGERLIPAEAENEISRVSLFLLGLAMAADPKQKTPVNLKLTTRRGRPKKNIVEVQKYRSAGRYILENKAEGYLSAAIDAAKEFDVDRTEAQAWAGWMDREQEQLSEYMARMRFYEHARGRFEVHELEEQKIYLVARQAVDRIRGGEELTSELAKACAETGLEEAKMRAWINEVEFAQRMNPEK